MSGTKQHHPTNPWDSISPPADSQEQADAHVTDWLLDKWFWETQAQDLLESRLPPKELWS